MTDRLKPNVAAQGEGAYFANTDGTFIYGNGTSFSSPIMAGMMACLWQACPDINNMELINAVQLSGSIADSPDNKIGYGIPDFMAAHNWLSVTEHDEDDLFSEAKLFPNPFSSHVELSFTSKESNDAHVFIVDLTGRTVYESEHRVNTGFNTIRFMEMGTAPSGVYFIRLESGRSVLTSKLIKK